MGDPNLDPLAAERETAAEVIAAAMRERGLSGEDDFATLREELLAEQEAHADQGEDAFPILAVTWDDVRTRL